MSIENKCTLIYNIIKEMENKATKERKDKDMKDFDSKELKNYKGYGISKAWWIDSDGERIKKCPFFYVVDDGDDYIGEEFTSLEEAKKWIDTIA